MRSCRWNNKEILKKSLLIRRKTKMLDIYFICHMSREKKSGTHGKLKKEMSGP